MTRGEVSFAHAVEEARRLERTDSRLGRALLRRDTAAHFRGAFARFLDESCGSDKRLHRKGLRGLLIHSVADGGCGQRLAEVVEVGGTASRKSRHRREHILGKLARLAERTEERACKRGFLLAGISAEAESGCALSYGERKIRHESHDARAARRRLDACAGYARHYREVYLVGGEVFGVHFTRFGERLRLYCEEYDIRIREHLRHRRDDAVFFGEHDAGVGIDGVYRVNVFCGESSRVDYSADHRLRHEAASEKCKLYFLYIFHDGSFLLPMSAARDSRPRPADVRKPPSAHGARFYDRL